MDARGSLARRCIRHAAIIGLLAAALLTAAGSAFAQTPPAADQGPRFNQWGPGQSAPAPEGPTGADVPSPQRDGPPTAGRDAGPGFGPSAGSRGPMASPAPGPYAMPPTPEFAPSPDRWGGCNHDLRGSWQISGRQSDPYPYSYTSWIQVRQFRNWLQIDQPEDNLSYYGVCRGDYIELDVYSGGRFVGYEDGMVNSGPGPYYGSDSGRYPRMGFMNRPQGLRVRAEWNSFFGGLASGRETWYRW
jgi:hypothetical protein